MKALSAAHTTASYRGRGSCLCYSQSKRHKLARSIRLRVHRKLHVIVIFYRLMASLGLRLYGIKPFQRLTQSVEGCP